MYKLIECKSRYSYREDSQHLLVQFAYCNLSEDKTTVTQMFLPVKCREYFGDILYAEETKEFVGIYGFSYDPKTQKIDRDKVRLSLTSSSEILKDNLSIIHSIEDLYNLPRTVIIDTDIKGTVIAEGDPFWQSRGYLISLYTFLLKMLYIKFTNLNDWTKEVQSNVGKEASYLRYIGILEFKYLVTKLDKIMQTNEEALSTTIGHTNTYNGKEYTIHGSHGFVNTFKPSPDSYYRTIYTKKAQELLKEMK